ncbi:Holliday junction branch migration DNA helicase RuvB [Mycoplasma corogypsi]|uniref:Holliday junction branch migration DNA helicase RuvB n=1 Tax=Mycoplasma corogypsi TaxID=2106 RepID=UPI0038736BA2
MYKLENRLTSFSNFIGQDKIIQTLKAMINSTLVQETSFPHTLIYGAPGMGKTTLASIIANELQVNIHYIQGANIEKKSDLISVLSLIQENDIVFIDEIHSINKNVIEFLYNAMEDFVFDLILGVDDNAKAMRMRIKPFTLIGATTKLNDIAQPLKDRFGYLARVVDYTDENINQIIEKTSQDNNIEISKNSISLISKYSRQTPRLANNLLFRVNDFAISENSGIIDTKIIHTTFKSLDLYEYGLTKDHIEYMQILYEGFDELSVALDTICGLVLHSKETIVNEIEPILLFHKFILKTSRGRKITQKGIEYLKRQRL